jgi:salicylate hydroxylase
MDIAIIGCGIGGAGLALALSRRGIPCRVFERDESLDARAQGYGITLQQAAATVVALGLASSIAGTSSTAHFSFLPDGTFLGAFGRGLVAREAAAGIAGGGGGAAAIGTAADSGDTSSGREEGGSGGGGGGGNCRRAPRFNIHLPRQELRRTLVEALPPGTVEWGARLVALEEGATGVALHFAGDRTVHAAVVVGADGIYSTVRRLKLGPAPVLWAPAPEGPALPGGEAPAPPGDGAPVDPAPLRYLGVVVILGMAPCTHPLLRTHVVQTLDGASRVYTMPFTAEPPVVMWQASFPAPQERAEALARGGKGALKAAAVAMCAGWLPPVAALVAATPEGAVTGYPAFDRDVPRPEALRGAPLSRVTLLGDAAHPMSPFKGQGANQALVDALALARALEDALELQRGAAAAQPGAGADDAGGGARDPGGGTGASSGETPAAAALPLCSRCGKRDGSKGGLRAAKKAAAAVAAAVAAAPPPPHVCTACHHAAARAEGRVHASPRQPKRPRNTHGTSLLAEERAEAALFAGARELLERRRAGAGAGAAGAAEAMLRAPLPHALASFERLMLARAGAKVLQSRAVAAFLHSPAAAAPVDCAAAAAARDAARMSLMGCRRKRAGETGDSGGGLDAVYATLPPEEDAAARALAARLQRGEDV